MIDRFCGSHVTVTPQLLDSHNCEETASYSKMRWPIVTDNVVYESLCLRVLCVSDGQKAVSHTKTTNMPFGCVPGWTKETVY